MATNKKQQLPKLHLPQLSLDFSNFSLFSSSNRGSARLSTPSTSTNERHPIVKTERSPTFTGTSQGTSSPAISTSPSPSAACFPRYPEKPATIYGPQSLVKSLRPRPLLRISTSLQAQVPPLPGSRPLIPSPLYTPPHSTPLPNKQQQLGLPSPGPPSLHNSTSHTPPHSASVHGGQRLRPQNSSLNTRSSNLTPPLSASFTPGQRLEQPTLSRWSDSDSDSSSSLASHPSLSAQHSNRSSTATTLSLHSHASKAPALDPLPPNGSPVPVLWTIDANSKYAPGYRHVVSKLGFILHDAHLSHPQFGLFRAGENKDWNRNPEVLAILLEERDLMGEAWRVMQEPVWRLAKAYWNQGGVPPVRFWRKWDGADGTGVMKGGKERGRESWMGKPLGVAAEMEREAETETDGEMGREGESVEVGVGRPVVVDFAIAKRPMRRPVIVRCESSAQAGPQVGAGGGSAGGGGGEIVILDEYAGTRKSECGGFGF